MGETREQLTRPLLRARLTEERTGLVVVAWQPWFELVDRIIRGLESGLTDVENNPEQGDVAVAKRVADPVDIPVASEHEARRLAKDLEQVQAFSDVPQLAELVNRAFDTGAQFAAGEGSPPAPQALNLGRRSGEYYRRWALAI